jgi:hypothetical protein
MHHNLWFVMNGIQCWMHHGMARIHCSMISIMNHDYTTSVINTRIKFQHSWWLTITVWSILCERYWLVSIKLNNLKQFSSNKTTDERKQLTTTGRELIHSYLILNKLIEYASLFIVLVIKDKLTTKTRREPRRLRIVYS